jgi:hypothetical protein
MGSTPSLALRARIVLAHAWPEAPEACAPCWNDRNGNWRELGVLR